jgi:hypothetical protein
MGPWQPPQLESLTWRLGDDDPTLTSDLLEMYFEHMTDIFHIHRSTPTSQWSTPMSVAAVNVASQAGPEIARDRLALYFTSNAPGGAGGYDLWVSTRASPVDGWGMPASLSINSTRGETSPTVDREASDPWGPPRALTELNTAGEENGGCLTADGLTLYFYSDRLGSSDLFVASRTSLIQPFAAAVPLDSLNLSTTSEKDPWVSEDEHHLFFTSDRAGQIELWRSTR